MTTCEGCGDESPGLGTPRQFFAPRHCGVCPPWLCAQCGQVCSAIALCDCWGDLTNAPLADIKGLLALGGLSVTTSLEDRS